MADIKKYTVEELLAMDDKNFESLSKRARSIQDIMYIQKYPHSYGNNNVNIRDILYYAGNVSKYALIAGSITAIGYFAYRSVQYVVDKNYQMVNEVRKEQRNERI